MSEDTVQEEIQAPELPGRHLLEARKAAGMAIGEVASRLNLPVEVVNGLETDDYEQLPESTYVRGYLLAYVRLLELPESLLESFDTQNQVFTPLLSDTPRALAGSSGDGWVKFISGSLVVLLIVAVGIWVAEQPFSLTERLSSFSSGAVPVSVQDSTSELASPETPDVHVPHVSDAAGDDAAPVDSETTESPIVVEDPDQLPEDVPVPAVAGPGNTAELIMRFRGSSWIKVDDVHGEQLRSATFEDGQLLTLNGDTPMKVTIGRAKNVELIFKGEPVDLSSYHDRVARLTLGE